MSRSFKKTPKKGITSAETEKQDKRKANRRFRRKTKIQVQKEEPVLYEIREVSNIWSFDKDGKKFIKNSTKKDLRK